MITPDSRSICPRTSGRAISLFKLNSDEESMDYTQMLVSRKTLSFMELFAVPGSPALKIACACVSFAMWLEKGLGLVVAGFIPNPFEQVRQYFPTIPEVMIALGVWATGFFVLTLLYRIATSVKEEVA